MSQLRLRAKLNGLYALRGSWIKAIISFAIVALLGFGITKLNDAYRLIFDIPRLSSNNLNTDLNSFIIEAVFSIILFFVMVPLVLGMLEWYWNLTGGKQTGIEDIFAWYGSFRLYRKSIFLNLNIFIRTFLWGIITCGLPIAMIFASNYYLGGINLQKMNLSAVEMQKLLFAGLLILFGTLLFVGGFILFLYIITRYILAYFLMVEDSTRGVSEVIRESIKYSRNYRWEMTKFLLSFTGYAIACILLIPMLYAVPYFCSSLSILSKHIIFSQRARPVGETTINVEA